MLVLIPWIFWTADLSIDKLKFTEEWYKFSFSFIQIYIAFLVFNYLFPNYRERAENRRRFLNSKNTLKHTCLSITSIFTRIDNSFSTELPIGGITLSVDNLPNKLREFDQLINTVKEYCDANDEDGYVVYLNEYYDRRDSLENLLLFYNNDSVSEQEINLIVSSNIRSIGDYCERLYNRL